MKVAVAHPGTQHSWQTATALQRADLLEWFATGIFHNAEKWPYRAVKFLPDAIANKMLREFSRFDHPALDPRDVLTFGAEEWAERIAGRVGMRKLAGWLDRRGSQQFARRLRPMLQSSEEFGVWGFDGSAADIFATAKALDRPCVLDRTIGDWRAFNAQMDALEDSYGNFFPQTGIRAPQWRIDQDDREYDLADTILVGSRFARDTVARHGQAAGISGKLRVLNYCWDEGLFSQASDPKPTRRDGPLRFLFIGQGTVRKGIQHVLEAIIRVPQSAASLTIVGDLAVPDAALAPFRGRFEHRAPVPRSIIPKLLSEADVLLFPTYFEGGGIVLYEALRSGVALIQSDRASIAVDDSTGILMDQLNSDALYEAMMAAIEDRDRVDRWKAAAPARAQEFSFSNYAAGVTEVARDLSSVR